MKREAGGLRLSPSDVANHLACRHLTSLDRGVAEGAWPRPRPRPEAKILAQRGLEHERAYLDHLARSGRTLLQFPEDEGSATPAGRERTLAAMREGADVVVQATLAEGRWLGIADVLLRVEKPSRFGAWSYEALDTKLARETRAGAILQLCLYSDLLEQVQGVRPEFMHIVPRRPEFPRETYRVDEHLAYYRLVRRRLEAAADATEPLATYPEPVAHCAICPWWSRCDGQRRADDHLSLVAGVTRLQRRELADHEIVTLAALAREPLPLAWKPRRGSRESLVRSREQARVQLEGREAGKTLYELLPREPGRGLSALPEPSPRDLFLDFEADPYVDEGGLEYLFGWATLDLAPAGMLPLEFGPPAYRRIWALDRIAERRAFEELIDTILAQWAADPGMHVYHFGGYETGAIKRLMGRYATREAEVDSLLRAERFVDLHAVVRQTLRASVEEYSIKKLEALYGFTREQPLEEADRARRVVERGLELGAVVPADAETAKVVEDYNRDDVLSTRALRDWLEDLRARRIAAGEGVERPAEESGEASERVGDRERRAGELAARLLEGVPELEEDRRSAPDLQARWLLAHVLDFHRREEKAPWWEYFRLRELSDEDLLDESAGLSGLERVERVSAKRPVIDRYRFPAQETSIRAGDKLRIPDAEGSSFGEVEAIDLHAHTIDIRKGSKSWDLDPPSVFKHHMVGTEAMFESLLRLGEWVAAHGIDADGENRAARDLLLRRPPRIRRENGGELVRPGEDALAAARRVVLALDHGALAIQGPPGSGKTYTGARMICDLVAAGKKVGVCAHSHKVIENLLLATVKAAHEERVPVHVMRKPKEAGVDPHPRIHDVKDNAEARAALHTGQADVFGGTPWLWARAEFFESVDVLFVDEAGQLSLANVLAIAQCAKAIVLLGDSQQLEQPIQGFHPPGTAASALEHVLEGHATIPPDRGLFLAETWRLSPAICTFTSEMFYESRLEPRPGLDRQAILGPTPFTGSGLRFVPVAHEGNQSACREEVEAVAGILAGLTDGSTSWRDRDGVTHPLGLEDVLVIAPYNAQVADLRTRLPEGARVDTVDRFQGQEAPAVIYSMTTSSAEDAPRGMEFFYRPNRFNVATSRARCVVIVVGNPRVFAPECQTPKQIELANAFCRYLELAATVERSSAAGHLSIAPTSTPA